MSSNISAEEVAKERVRRAVLCLWLLGLRAGL
jgi:hypothetical protein